MNAERRRIEQSLSHLRDEEPPAGLRDAIGSEIPFTVREGDVRDVLPFVVPARRRPWRAHAVRLAAMLFVAAGAVVVLLRGSSQREQPVLPLVPGPTIGTRAPSEDDAGAPPVVSNGERSVWAAAAKVDREQAGKKESADQEAPRKAGELSALVASGPPETRSGNEKVTGLPAAPALDASTMTMSPPIEQRPQPAAAPNVPPVSAATERIVTGKSPVVVTSQQSILASLGYLGSFESKKSDRGSARPAPSTGGTAEPNDQPYGDVFFKTYGVNPFLDTDDENLSTFGLEVDTGSYNVARRYLTDGNLPPAEAIRVEEFLNAMRYGDAPPTKGDFALYVDGAPSPRGPEYRYVRFGLKAREVSAANRKPARLVFCVDVSGSMAAENRLDLVKKALGLLLDGVREDDRVGLVVFGSNGRVLLPMTSDHAAIRFAIDRLAPEGSTNTEEGLLLAYRMAEENLQPGTIGRVILCSDGVANVGRTGPDSIFARIEGAAKKGIELTTVGFGMGNYNDVLMEQLANRGRGRYAYVDTLDEAKRIFVEELTGTLQTVAESARVQVSFDRRVVSRFRLVGYENRAIANERFRDDKLDAGWIGAGHAVTALYEVKLRADARAGDVAKLTLRWRPAEKKEFLEQAVALPLQAVPASWERSRPAVRLAALVAEFAEVLKESYWAKGADLSRTARNLHRLAAELGPDDRLADLIPLVDTAARLKKARAGATPSPAAVTPE